MKLYYCYDNNEFTLRKDDDSIPSASCWVPNKFVSFPFDSAAVSVAYEDEDEPFDEDEGCHPLVEEELIHIPRHLIYLIQFKDTTGSPYNDFQPSFIMWLSHNQPSMLPTSFRKVSNI